MSQTKELLQRTYSVKKRFLAMYHAARAGHVGSSLSCAEVLTFIRFGWMSEGDELLLSKGHAAGALYALLAEAGDLSSAEIESFYRDGTLLAGHPPPGKIKAIPFATGSLGHGLSLSAGMALGAKIQDQNEKLFFCLTSDGELNEGSIWEAALFLRQQHLHRVVWLIDRNQIQGFGRTEEVMKLEPLRAKLEAFGFNVIEADGHRFESLIAAKEEWRRHASVLPQVILCRTVKGHGSRDLQDTVDCHYLPMSDDQYRTILKDLETFYQGQGLV